MNESRFQIFVEHNPSARVWRWRGWVEETLDRNGYIPQFQWLCFRYARSEEALRRRLGRDVRREIRRDAKVNAQVSAARDVDWYRWP